MPKVSVVLPVYNVEPYLKQCMDSVCSQTLSDIEIICVDDGSTDNSAEILDEYAKKDPRVKVIHKANEGYGKALNVGTDFASGEYLAILEPDDFILPNMYATLYEEAKKNDSDVVKSDYFDCTTVNNEINLKYQQLTRRASFYCRDICPNDEQEVYNFFMHTWTGIYKLEYIRKHNIRHHETPGASFQDIGFFFQTFSQTKKLRFLPQAFYCYRVDNLASSTHEPRSKKFYEMPNEYEFVRQNLERIGIFEALADTYYGRVFRALNQMYLQLSPELKTDFADLFRNKMLEAKDSHHLNTGLLSEKHRFLLLNLLSSVGEYEYVVLRGKKKVPFLKLVDVLRRYILFYGKRSLLLQVCKKILKVR